MQHFFHQPIYGKLTVAKLLFITAMALIIIFNLAPHFALGIGLLLGLTSGNPYSNLTKKYTKIARSLWGAYLLKNSAKTTTWKEVWSAGQGVGLIEDILPAAEIVDRLVRECRAAKVPE